MEFASIVTYAGDYVNVVDSITVRHDTIAITVHPLDNETAGQFLARIEQAQRDVVYRSAQLTPPPPKRRAELLYEAEGAWE
jgi:hypothetical protein